MSPLPVIPDAEAIFCVYLDDHPDVTALGARVAGQTPSTHVGPWVRVTQIDAIAKGGVEHLIDYFMQFDCFAGNEAMRNRTGQAEASALVRTVRAALKDAQDQTVGGAVVSDVTFTGMLRSPDTRLAEPARERWMLSTSISMHA